jgi:lambda repressor-like predicted transcriptional regulator
MDTKQIKAALEAKDCSIPILAKAINKSYSAVYSVCQRKMDSSAIAVFIAKAIEKPVEEVFPDKPQYHPNYDPQAQQQKSVELWRQRLSA